MFYWPFTSVVHFGHSQFLILATPRLLTSFTFSLFYPPAPLARQVRPNLKNRVLFVSIKVRPAGSYSHLQCQTYA